MKFIISIFTLLLPMFLFGETLKKPDSYDHGEAESASTQEYKINISDDFKTTALIEMTTKGNGWLTILNLSLSIYDDHNDMAYYEDVMLQVSFTDLNNDGFKDILISGIVNYSDEKGNMVIAKENVQFIYTFNSKVKKFKETFRRASFSLENGASNRSLTGDKIQLLKIIANGRKESEKLFP